MPYLAWKGGQCLQSWIDSGKNHTVTSYRPQKYEGMLAAAVAGLGFLTGQKRISWSHSFPGRVLLWPQKLRCSVQMEELGRENDFKSISCCTEEKFVTLETLLEGGRCASLLPNLQFHCVTSSFPDI